VTGLSDAREELTTALEAADIRVASPGDAFTPPCVRVHPAAPWLAPSVLASGRRTQRWEVWAVAGKVADRHNYTSLEGTVSAVTNALDLLPSWSSIVWDRPNPTDMGGTSYLAVRGQIETNKEV